MKFPRFSSVSAAAGFSKVVIYLAFMLGVLWLLYSFGSFVYLMGHAGDLSGVAVTNLLQLHVGGPVAAPQQVAALDGSTHFRLFKVYAEYSFLQMPRKMILCIFTGYFAMIFLFFMAFVNLANLIENLTAGKRFVRDNAVFARRIGLAMIGYGVLKIGWQVVIVLLFHDALAIPGMKMPLYTLFTDYFRPEIILAGFVVLVIADAFRQAAAMREEQELTV